MFILDSNLGIVVERLFDKIDPWENVKKKIDEHLTIIVHQNGKHCSASAT